MARHPDTPAGADVARTLEEALEGAPAAPTLLWGRDLVALSHRLPGSWQARLVAPDLGAAVGAAVPARVDVAPGPEPFARALVRLPRSREELAWWLAVAASRLPPGGQVWVAGHQREGIRSAAGPLAELIGPAVVARTKRHCRVLVATLAGAPAAPPDLADFTRPFDAPLAGAGGGQGPVVRCATVAGTFSHGRLDDGTRRLLDLLPAAPAPARALDLGAGCGVLGAAVALLHPAARVDLVEDSAAGLASCRLTLARSGLDAGERVRALLADAADAPAGPYDLVVTNPPFHDGREQDRGQAGAFARAAARRLASGGQLLLVANRHLGYREDLEAAFAQVEIAWEDGRFRVWRARRPRAA